ncbi:hypothetical protein A4X03_0g3247, partial [Tilletia caries]
MQSSSSAGATDPWAEEESHAPALSAMVSSSDPTQHDDDNGDNDEDNDKDDDKDADKEEEEEDEPASTEDSDHLAPPTSELHTLNLSSAPASSNPWAESLPADPLAPSST